ncbi:hypothetical protein [Anaerosporobacter sp.]|uniref:hypothetical protein n=1 Tax=Anaerosporobacter sp. TaxID=1872529 RepID=UPI00286EFE88|nr:hypothetical protein [Anaerosporobacter sp.]
MAVNQVNTNAYATDFASKNTESAKVDISTIEESFKKAIERYSDFVEKRLEDGEPTYQIGASSMTEKEWDTLITKVDTSINQFKEELRARIKVLKERDEKKKIIQEQRAEKELLKKDLLKELNDAIAEDAIEKHSQRQEEEEDAFIANQENSITPTTSITEEQLRQLLAD